MKSMLNASDCYNILGIQRGASQKEIKEAYRKLTLQYHPDRNKEENDEKFKKIVEAYQFLKTERKKTYRKSESDIEARYANFWRYYDKNVNEEPPSYAQGNFGRYRNPFGVNGAETYSHNQEKPVSHMRTHILIFGGLGLVALWIILSGIK